MHAWSEAGKPLRRVKQSVAKDDPDPKALACFGVLVRWFGTDGVMREQPLLRFVDGRPVSAVPAAFLERSCTKLESLGKKAPLPVWDNAPWHVSREVRGWIREHNVGEKGQEKGVRIVSCYLPIKSPWLNPTEPR